MGHFDYFRDFNFREFESPDLCFFAPIYILKSEWQIYFGHYKSKWITCLYNGTFSPSFNLYENLYISLDIMHEVLYVNWRWNGRKCKKAHYFFCCETPVLLFYFEYYYIVYNFKIGVTRVFWEILTESRIYWYESAITVAI